MSESSQLSVRVVPNASRAEVVGWLADGVLKVKVTAPPEGGRANAEVCALLAKTCGLPKRAVQVERGAKNRNKQLLLDAPESAWRASLPSNLS